MQIAEDYDDETQDLILELMQAFEGLEMLGRPDACRRVLKEIMMSIKNSSNASIQALGQGILDSK